MFLGLEKNYKNSNLSEFCFLLKVHIVRNSFTKFSNVLLVSSLSIYSNAADYKPQRLDEKKYIVIVSMI